MKAFNALRRGTLLTGAAMTGLTAAFAPAQAENFTLRIAAGHPAPPLA